MRRRMSHAPDYSEDARYEHYLGIESESVVYNNRYNDEYHRYEPSSYDCLVQAFDALKDQVSVKDRFVDFGCGKGRVLFYAHQRFDCSLCGIEVDEDLYEIAKENLKAYHKKFRDGKDQIQLILGKAEDYEVMPQDTVFYFFNPFTLEIFEQVMMHILDSVKQYPRKIYVIMYYPNEEYQNWMKRHCFSLFRLVKLDHYDQDCMEKVMIYETQ